MNEPLPQFIHPIVDRLRSIEGMVAIALGGSRAGGNHTPKSEGKPGNAENRHRFRTDDCGLLPASTRGVRTGKPQ